MAREGFDRLRKLLDELFQFDRADLDFGIYRIMNRKRVEIGRFLNEDLLPQVREALGTYRSAEREAVQAELEDQERSLRSLGMNEASISDVPAIRDLRNKLAETADAASIEDRIYSDLYTFFSRYYKDGDFVSLRRYKPGVYAIPYEGEEVKLYWANADQYYVKTSETFQDYRFRLTDGRHMHFRLGAAETERDNNKATDGQERRFVLRSDEPVEEVGGELNVYFEYRPSEEKQAKINEATVKRLLGLAEIEMWRAALRAPAATGSNANRTLLEKHLADYTARNSFDYFVHKDLGGFLRREFEFYLKNEVLHVDDLDTDDERRATQYLARLRAIKQVGYKIIDFLAQLEDFQKKLWLKKKFVVKAEYCVTLDRVPEALYPDIAANDAQRKEWVRLFAIDEIMGNLMAPSSPNPLTVEFLRENPYLVLDTAFFDDCFKTRLLASFNDLDGYTDGLLINSENYQALNLLLACYREKVKCIYIDPPYNTGGDDFIYKDNYRHSSWLSMMEDRLRIGREIMNESAVMFISIDDRELLNLGKLLNTIFGERGFVANFVRRRRMATGMRGEPVSPDHEYVLAYAKLADGMKLYGTQRNELGYPYEDEKGKYASTDLTVGMTKEMRPNQYYPIRNPRTGEEYWPSENRVWRFQASTMQQHIGEDNVIWPDEYPARNMSRPRFKTRYSPDEVGKANPVSTWIDTKTSATAGEDDGSEVLAAGMNQAGTKELSDIFGAQVLEYPKPVSLIQSLAKLGTRSGDLIVDYFAGSGTTGHAVIALNREDGGHRKYILVEMGEYFDTVMKPRVQKVIYSKDWKDGKPVSREGAGHMFKYMTLESYEDALNNLEVRRPATETVPGLFDESRETREDYMLRYMLDLETRGSASLLDLHGFEDPFNYQLRIRGGSETHAMKVDLVETFNWLLGLRAQKIRAIDGYRTVEGLAPDGKRVLAIWRSLRDERHSNEALERFFEEQGYGKRVGDEALDRIYVNGDCTLANLRETADPWDVLLTEEEFKRLMFEPTGEGVLS